MRGGAGRDFVPTAVVPPADTDLPPELVLRKYFDKQESLGRLHDYTVDVRIDAALPAMHRQGTLTATRTLSGDTDLSYSDSNFTGDNSVKGDVIARYLNAERESLRRPLNVGLTPENYRFTYRGVANYLDYRVHVFEVTPRQKRLGLYRGELWLEVESGQPLREFGRFVRNPSVFLKDVDFVRDYHLVDGRALPVRVITNMDTRLVGPAEITITYTEYAFNSKEQPGGQELTVRAPNSGGPSSE